MKRYVLFLFACLVSSFLYAQTATDIFAIGFRIGSVEKNGNVLRVSIENGLEAGIKLSQEVRPYGILRDNPSGHNVRLGTGRLTEVTQQRSIAEIIPYDGQTILAGDLLYVYIALPKKQDRSPYFWLVTDAIDVVDAAGTPYYTYSEIMQRDGARLRTEKFKAMERDIRAEGERLKAANDKARVQAGPNEGQFVTDVMTQTDTMAVWYYVYYLNQMESEYRGTTIRLNEGYRKYIEEGDAISPGLLKSSFDGLTEAQIDEKHKQYKRKLTKEQLDSWKDDAEKLGKDGSYDEAAKLYDICIALAIRNKSVSDAGIYSFMKGELYDTQRLYLESSAAYENALGYFLELKNEKAEAFAYHGAGWAYYKLNLLDKAGDYISKAVVIRSNIYKENPSTANYNNLYSSIDNAATLTFASKDYKSTLDFYESALTLSQKHENKSNAGSMLWNIGYTYEDGMKEHKKAIETYAKAYNVHLEIRDTADAVSLKRNLTICYKNLEDYKSAESQLQEGITLARSWGKPATLAYVLEYGGLMFFEHSEYEKSVKYYTEVEQIYRKSNDTKKLEGTLKKLAKSMRDANMNTEAIAKFKERLPLIPKENLSDKADVYWDLAYTYGHIKDRKNEVAYYKEAENIYVQLKDSANLSTILNNLGYAYRDSKDSVNAYKYHQKALALDRLSTDKSRLAYSYDHVADSYKSFGNMRKSADAYEEASKLYAMVGNFSKAGSNLSNAGHRYADMKMSQKSADVFKKVEDFYRQAGDKGKEAEAYWNWAYQTGWNLKSFDEAIANYKIAYDLYMEVKDSVNASVMLSNIGQNYWSKLDYEKAIESHKAAIELAKKCRNNEQVASSWSRLATLYKESNNPIAATTALSHAATALLQINDSTLLSSTYQELGNSYSKSKHYGEAIDYLEKSIGIRKKQRDTVNWASSSYDLAFVYHTRNDMKNAERMYLESASLRKKIKDKDGQVYALVGLGNIEENIANNYKKAEEYFLLAEKIARETRNEYIQAFIYAQMKWLYRSEGKPALAEASVKKALEIYRKNKYWKEVANTLVSQAFDVSYVQGDQVRAMKILDEAQGMADTLKDLSIMASVYGQRGTILREMGEFQQALEFADKSKKLYVEIDNEWGIAGTYIDRGNILKSLSDYEEAIISQKTADSLYKKINAEYSRLAPLANIGENYAAQGDYVKAMEYYHQSLAIMQRANDLNENLAIIQALMGEANFYLNNYVEANKWLRQSLETCDKVGAMRPKADNLGIMARLKVEEKKYDEARTYITEGLKIGKEKSMKLAYLNNLVVMGKLEVESKNYAAAKPYLEECTRISKEMSKLNTLWESLYLQGVIAKEGKQLPQSRDYLKQSVEVIEKIRNKVSGGEEARKLFSSDKNILKVYEVLVDVLLQLGETDVAMSYLQKNNEDNLKAKFRGMDIKFQDDNKNKVIGQERDMKAKLDGIEQQISKEKALPQDKQNLAKLKNLEGIQSIAETDYLKFVNQQVNVQPELSKFFNNSVQPSEFRKRKKQIPKDMALLSYLPGENQLYIFMATTDTVIAKVVNITRAQLGKEVNGVMNVVKTQQGTFSKIDLSRESEERAEIVTEVKQTDKNMRPFEELYHYLVAPVSAEIATKKKLCVIPNGSLSYIPFQLLGKTLSNGKFSFLANQFSIFYANSTDMLLRTLEAEAKNYNILAFGNPDKTLPSTEKEVQDIKKLYPSAAIYTRDDATEDKAKFAGEKFNVMHFATHGNLDYEDFSKSYLTMAGNPAKNEDGRLTLEELWGMEVMNHLNIVVLSACQTAVTKGSNESSPVSPASGFLQNGVKSVVATLWKVDDEATSLLIGDFYKNIKTMDAVDALRQAQVNLSANPKFAYPYYWAGAILLGDWR
jgi:CHAT domain-containing protein